MNKEDIVIPTIFLGVVILTSFVPVVQIILMTLCGGLTHIVTIPFDSNERVENIIGIIFNSILTLIGLFLFYKTKTTLTRILTSFFVLFFGHGIMLFTVDQILKGDESYYINWTVLSGTPVLLTLLVGLLKYWTLNSKQMTET